MNTIITVWHSVNIQIRKISFFKSITTVKIIDVSVYDVKIITRFGKRKGPI